MAESRQFIEADEAQDPFIVGIDLGATSIKLGVVDDLGRPLSWLSIPTRGARGPEDAARRIAAAIPEAIHKAGLEPSAIVRVGLASAGALDIPAGVITTPVNLKGWDDAPIRDLVAHHSHMPVTFENDGNAAAYGEFWVGAGRKFSSLVLLTLGTGIGCGIVLKGQIVRGAHSHGGESGHIIIDADDDARLCECGCRGHLEAYASATAVIKRAQEALHAGRQSSLRRRIAEGASLTPKLIAGEAEAGDAFSTEIVLDTARYLGVGVVSLVHMLEPKGVFLGGAMTFGGPDTALGRRFLARVREEVQRRALAPVAEKTSIEFAVLGGDAGFIGAAGVARLDYLRLSRR
jgi:glucokinase